MAGFLRLPGGMLQVHTDDGEQFVAPGYMAGQFQAGGMSEMPPPAGAPVPAPPPDMGPPAGAPAPLPIADPNVAPVAPLPPVTAPLLQVAPPTPVAPPVDPSAPAPFTADPSTVAPTQGQMNAPMDQVSRVVPPEEAKRLAAKVDAGGLDFGSAPQSGGGPVQSAAPAAAQYSPPETSGTAIDVAMSGGGGGGFGLAGRSVQHEQALTGKPREAIERSMQDQMAAARDAAMNQNELLIAQREAQKLANEREQQRQEARANAVLSLQKKRDEALAAVPKGIDPNAWDKSGGIGRMLAVIASAVGGYASGMTGMQNPGIQMMQAAQRDSVDAQKAEIALAQERGDRADNDLEKAIAEFGGDPVAAEDFIKMKDTQQMVNAVQERLDKAQDEVARDAYRQTLADLNAQLENQRAHLDGRMGTVVDNYQAMQAPDPGDKILRAAQIKKALDELAGKKPDEDSRQEKLYRESQVRLPATMGGGKAWAKDKETATKAQGIIEAHSDFAENMKRLDEISKSGGKSMSPTDRAEVESLVQSNIALMKQIEDLGAITSADQDLVRPLTGMGTADFFSMDESKRKSREVAMRHVDRRIKSALRNLYSDPQLSNPASLGGLGQKAPE